jgi:hypothetical protein
VHLKTGVLPAVHCLGSSFAVYLDGACFSGSGTQITFRMTEPDPATVVVAIEVELLSRKHRQSATA